MRFELTPLGTGAALPARGRSPSAQILNANEHLFLIDCGEGTQERIREAGFNLQRIGHVFISHLHGDHYLGLFGLISTMHLLGRTADLHVHAPADLREIIHVQLRASKTYLRFPLHITDLPEGSGRVIVDGPQLTVTTLELKHRLPTTGFIFRERSAKRRLRPERIKDIPLHWRNRVKDGEDLVLESGVRVPCDDLTIAPPPPRSYAYCTDTAYAPELIPHLKGVDLLYHEATFTEHLKDRARETLHSTARDAAAIAHAAGVGRLLLGHFSSRYKDLSILLEEALAIFPHTALSEEGVTIPIDRSTAVERS